MRLLSAPTLRHQRKLREIHMKHEFSNTAPFVRLVLAVVALSVQ